MELESTGKYKTFLRYRRQTQHIEVNGSTNKVGSYNALENIEPGLLVNGKRINTIKYADDTVIIAENLKDLQHLMNNVVTLGGIYMNIIVPLNQFENYLEKITNSSHHCADMLNLKWSPTPPEWQEDAYRLLLDYKTDTPQISTIDSIMENSSKFPIEFPVDTVRLKFLNNHVHEEISERNINSVYPIIHHKALELFCKFILFKRKHGSQVEKKLYRDMNLKEFIERLLKKRAVSFLGAKDRYLLLNGREGSGKWDTIGKNNEEFPLILKDCLSYDEIKCSVFLNVSSYTYFINRGDRKNMAKFVDDRSNLADEGIIIGMIGPRLKKPNVMEYQEIVITDKQNTSTNGFGTGVQHSLPKLFSTFYEENSLSYKEALKVKESDRKRFSDIKKALFDNHIYYKRMSISFDMLLMEANHRAKNAKQMAYIHVVGLGLGVWRISPHQGNVFMDTFADRIEILGSHLDFVSDICFSYITPLKCGIYNNGDVFAIEGHPLGGIRIHMYKREPHDKVSHAGNGKLLVVSYAWDGNALPGNEWWMGKLGSSGDSAAASSTQITELHNPHINPVLTSDSLMVVTENDVVSLEKYQEIVRCKKSKRQMETSE